MSIGMFAGLLGGAITFFSGGMLMKTFMPLGVKNGTRGCDCIPISVDSTDELGNKITIKILDSSSF